MGITNCAVKQGVALLTHVKSREGRRGCNIMIYRYYSTPPPRMLGHAIYKQVIRDKKREKYICKIVTCEHDMCMYQIVMICTGSYSV
jgi:hypothetical protein